MATAATSWQARMSEGRATFHVVEGLLETYPFEISRPKPGTH